MSEKQYLWTFIQKLNDPQLVTRPLSEFEKDDIDEKVRAGYSEIKIPMQDMFCYVNMKNTWVSVCTEYTPAQVPVAEVAPAVASEPVAAEAIVPDIMPV